MAVYPLTGDTMIDRFTLGTSGWWDKPEDMPLGYRFFRAQVDAEAGTPGLVVPLTVSSTLPSATVHLPFGDQEITAQVADIHGATSVKKFTVTVTVPDVSGIAGEMDGLLLDVVQRQAADAISGGHSLLVMQLANAVGDVMNAGDAAYWREKQATGEFSTGRRRLGGGEMDDAQNGETDDQNGRRRLGAETSLRLDMLQHILSVSTTTLLTPEIGQAQAHAMAKMTGVASELSADSLFTAFGIINSVAHTATAASPTDAVAAAAVMHAGVSNVLDASNLDAAFNGLPAGTPSGEIFDQARKALDQIATGLLQALSCGESAAELVSARMSTLVTRECNIFDSVMAGQDYQIPGRGVQTVDIRTPVFVSPPSKGSSVGVAMTLFHVNPAGVFSGLRPALITRSNHSL